MDEKERINILLVDDLLVNLLALEAIIERESYRLIKATSGEEALKLILKYDFAVILLDVQMPGLDGFDTAKIIKAREKTKDIPIIFITANNMDTEHVFTGYSVGAVDYILKPLDPFILKAKVEVFVQLYEMKKKLIQQADTLANSSLEIKKAYQELHSSQTLAKVISDTSIDSMVVLNMEGLILSVNPAVAHMFQYSNSDIIGQKIESLFRIEDQKHIYSMLSKMTEIRSSLTTEQLTDVMGVRKDGSLFPIEIQLGMSYVTEQDQYILACIIRDVTKNKQDHEIITKMAYYDWLTSLPNRRFFNDRIHDECFKAKGNNQPFSMLYLDLDRFKYVNDSLGHLIGDQLLIQIAKRLSGCLREDDFLARIGGDEFNILIPNTGRELALEYAEKILAAFAEPFYLDNFELFITTSVGIGVFPYDGEDPQTIIKNTDAALYRAKEKGKNQFRIFHSGMNIGSYRSFILQNDLHKAIERNELALVYQPRFDIRTGRINSVESLIRWNHPQWGIIFPSEFIPLAEQSSQIAEIGEWVLKELCRQHREWKYSGVHPIRTAVNFSTQQLLEKHIVAKIKQIFSEYDISLSLLELEITESTIAREEGHYSNTLLQLRQLGITISIDDFGTGNCSLRYLWKYPVDTLKIDKSIILNDLNSTESTSFLQMLIAFAHSLNLSVIAEGVETEEQLNQLREFGCEEFQGYLICPPVGPKEFENFLVNYKETDVIDNTIKVKSAVFNLPQSIGNKNEQILQTALHQTKEAHAISRREFEVFELMVEGHNNKEISQQLFISEHTVKNHISHIFQKLQVADRIQAMAKVYQACISEVKLLKDQSMISGENVE